MSEKKPLTTVRWIISGVLLAIVAGFLIAMLASGHAPSLYFVVSLVFVFVFFGLAIFANLAQRKANAAIASEKANASELAARRDFAGAIRVWKKLLPEVGEKHVNELLPRISSAYQEIGNSDGVELVSQLQRLYADFFDMTKRMKQLDAKGRAMRQSVADRICETVNKLPES